MYTVWSNNFTVWSNFLTVWSKSLRCEQNVYGVIKNLRVWSKIWRCDQTFKGVIKNLTVWSKLRWCDQDIVGVIKRPFAGNCLITPCGVIISHVFFWCCAQSWFMHFAIICSWTSLDLVNAWLANWAHLSFRPRLAFGISGPFPLEIKRRKTSTMCSKICYAE